MKVFGIDNPFAYNATCGLVGALVTPTSFTAALVNSALYTVIQKCAESALKPKGESATFGLKAFSLIASSVLTTAALVGGRISTPLACVLVITHVVGRQLAHAMESQYDRFMGTRATRQIGLL